MPETTETGRIINRIFKLHHAGKNDLLKYRGNILCLFYSPFEQLLGPPQGKGFKKDLAYEMSPTFTIGPDWKYVVYQLVLVNIVNSFAISYLKPSSFMYSFNSLSLVVWNGILIIMSLYNPGIAPRNPHIHS